MGGECAEEGVDGECAVGVGWGDGGGDFDCFGCDDCCFCTSGG